jgi:hypothetical protein
MCWHPDEGALVTSQHGGKWKDKWPHLEEVIWQDRKPKRDAGGRLALVMTTHS